MLKRIKTQLKEAYENTRPKIDKSVRNDVKDTYESFLQFDSNFVDHQVIRRLVTFMYEQPATLVDYISNNAIIAVDEYNRVKDTEETLTTEVNDFMTQLIESGKVLSASSL